MIKFSNRKTSSKNRIYASLLLVHALLYFLFSKKSNKNLLAFFLIHVIITMISAAMHPLLLLHVSASIAPCLNMHRLIWVHLLKIFCLEADALELGAVWLGIAPLNERMEAVQNVLDIPEDLDAFAIIPCGYPESIHPQQDRFEKQRIHYVL